MSHGSLELRGGERRRERRVRVPVDEHTVRLLVEDGPLDSGKHPRGLLGVGSRACLEAVHRRVEAELVEEDAGELAVVVLTRVQDDLLDASLEGERERDRT